MVAEEQNLSVSLPIPVPWALAYGVATEHIAYAKNRNNHILTAVLRSITI
jgi:hypothetical protein